MFSSDLYSASKQIPRVVIILFTVDVVLSVSYIVNYFIGAPFWKLSILLDLNDESSLASWYSSTQLFCVFVLSAIFSHRKISENSKAIPLFALPAIFLFLSIDESVQIHEWLGQKSDVLFAGGSRDGTYFDKTGIWMFVFGVPFLFVFLWIAYSLKQHIADKPSSLKKLVIGIVIMLTGALGFEALSNFVEDQFWVIEVAFEEGLEMIGVTIIFWSVYEMAEDYLPVVHRP